MKEYLDPIHPGEILLEDFLKPLGISGKPFISVPPCHCPSRAPL